jgi:hypothetical protein
MRPTSWVILLLGVWLAVSPMVLHVGGLLSTNNIACGVLAALAGVWGLMTAPRMHVSGWFATLLGLWILFAPWSLAAAAGLTAPEFANNALCGSVMAIFGIARSTSGPAPATV